MQLPTILKILGFLLMLVSLTLIPPLFVDFWYQSGESLTFHLSFVATFSIGFLLWFSFRSQQNPLRTRDGFLIVVLFWTAFCFVGTLPFYWANIPDLSFIDAFFESVSGTTTTGSTILTRLDNLPRSILYYRQQLQFVGGLSIIILAVAILPTLGVGGMQLFRTEITGPLKDDKLTPRITQTAKAFWLIYCGFVVLCLFFFRFAGMSWFDAICHSFSTVSTGGFSTHDASLHYFQSPAINLIAIVFMFLGAVNFKLHFLMLKHKKISLYAQDPEFRHFLRVLITMILIIWIALTLLGEYKESPYLVLDTFFLVISFTTTTGFISTDYAFPIFIPLLLIFCGVMGGCAGSTSGGMKVIRILLLQKQGIREIRRLIHPHGQYVIKLDGRPIPPRIIEAIWGFLAVYCVTFTILLCALLIVEKDFYSVYSALVATFSNTGPALGKAASDYSAFSPYAKWILSFAMILGRLEIFTILVLMTPLFWRR